MHSDVQGSMAYLQEPDREVNLDVHQTEMGQRCGALYDGVLLSYEKEGTDVEAETNTLAT